MNKAQTVKLLDLKNVQAIHTQFTDLEYVGKDCQSDKCATIDQNYISQKLITEKEGCFIQGNQKNVKIFAFTNGYEKQQACMVFKAPNFSKKELGPFKDTYDSVMANAFAKCISDDNNVAPTLYQDCMETYMGPSMEKFDFLNKVKSLSLNEEDKKHYGQFELIQNILDINECKFDFPEEKEKKPRERYQDYLKDDNGKELEIVKHPEYNHDVLLKLLCFVLTTGKTDIKNRNVCLLSDPKGDFDLCHIDYDIFDYTHTKDKTYDPMFSIEFFDKYYKDMTTNMLQIVSPTLQQIRTKLKAKQIDDKRCRNLSAHLSFDKVLEKDKSIINKYFKIFEDPDELAKKMLQNFYQISNASKVTNVSEEMRKEWIDKAENFLKKMYKYYEYIAKWLSRDHKNSHIATCISNKLQEICQQQDTFIKNVCKCIKNNSIDDTISLKVDNTMQNIDKSIYTRFLKNEAQYEAEEEIRHQKYMKIKPDQENNEKANNNPAGIGLTDEKSSNIDSGNTNTWHNCYGLCNCLNGRNV